MDSFVALASDSKRQAERRNSNHRLYDIVQQTPYPENFIAHDPCFDHVDGRAHQEPLHMSVESHEREQPWSDSSVSDSTLASTLVGAVQSFQNKIVEKLDNFAIQHKQAQKATIIPSERIPVASDVIRNKSQSTTVVEAPYIPASKSSSLGVPGAKMTVHLDQTKDLSALGNRDEFTKPLGTVSNTLNKVEKVIEQALQKPVEVVNNKIIKPLEKLETRTTIKPLEKLETRTTSSGFAKELDEEEFDREFQSTVV